MITQSDNDFCRVAMPKRVKVMTLFIVCSLLLYFAGFLGTSAWNRVSIGYYFPIHASGNDQNASETCWEYPLETLITVPKNLHFHLYMENTSFLSGKVLCEPLFLTVYGSPDGTKVFYEEKIYPPGKGHVSRNYHWSINQNWERVYIKLSLPDGINTVQVKKATLAWDLSLNPSIISVVFNQIFLNSKWLLAYVLVSIITLRMFFLRYYPAQAYKKLKIDFSKCTPWILLFLVLLFQFYMIVHSVYPLYEHDYELLLRSIKLLQTGSSENYVTTLGYFKVSPLPSFCLEFLVQLFGIRWGYAFLIVTRIGVIWAVWEITRQVYRDKSIAFTVLLFACILPFNLYFPFWMDVSGYSQKYYLDIGKIMAMTCLYIGIAMGFRMIYERNIFQFKLKALAFCCFGILALLSRFETIISYGLTGIMMIFIVWKRYSNYYLKIYLFIATICAGVALMLLYSMLKGQNIGIIYHSKLYDGIKIFGIYFITDHVFNVWFMTATAFFFRIIMIRFSLWLILQETLLLCCSISTIFALYYHSSVYARFIYVVPLQAIILGVGIVSMYQYFIQTFLLVKHTAFVKG